MCQRSVWTGRFELPCETLTLVSDGKALTHLFLGPKEVPTAVQRKDALIEQARIEIAAYLKGQRCCFTVPTHLKGTPFQEKIWRVLAQIPYGTVQTYKKVAVDAGCPKACRAVGHALHCNPLPLLLPCHRVVGTSGALTGFAGGLELKSFLLDLERKHLSLSLEKRPLSL